MAYDAKVLADSISPAGHRVMTLEVTLPRIVLAEFNTHRVFTRSSASSRAIPVEKRIASVQADPFVPAQFGKNKAGMQHVETLEDDDDSKARMLWNNAKWAAISASNALSMLGVHKQLANRLLEPFSWHTILVTATEWDNWNGLRISKHAQGEIRVAAEMMNEVRNASTPHALRYDEWHLPLVPELDGEVVSRAEIRSDRTREWWADWTKICVGRCARVSYLTHDGKRDPSKDIELHDALLLNGHMSPFEHALRPMSQGEIELFSRPDVRWVRGHHWEHVGTPKPWLGNVVGWVQYRKLLPNEDVYRDRD